jgi:hypothetical protein
MEMSMEFRPARCSIDPKDRFAALRSEVNTLRIEVERLRAEVTAFTQSDEDLPPDGRISVLRMAHRRGCSRDTVERLCKRACSTPSSAAIGGASSRHEDSAACGSIPHAFCGFVA